MLGSFVLILVVAQAAATVPPQSGATHQPPTFQTTPEQPWPPAGVVRFGTVGTTAPRLVREARPAYTADAKRAGIQGVVGMEVVVRADGTVGDVRVTRSLDKTFGLDDEAVKTVKKWRFAPGRKDGVAVPVLVEIEMTFTLR